MQYLKTSVITSLRQLQSRTLLYIIAAAETSVILLFKADFALLVFLISEYGKHTFFFFEAGNLLPLKKNLRCYSVVRAVIVIFQLVAARWNLCLIFHLSNGFSGCLLIYLECLSSLQVLE